jgi:hypothetical protein
MDEALTSMELDKATTQYDAEFRDVNGLTWLPWVGQRFSERPQNQRLLVVGESHYFQKGDTPEQHQANRDAYNTDLQRTREVVSGVLINQQPGWGRIKTLVTIPKLLFKTTEIDHRRLWADAAYYNFVQKAMDISQKERPAGDDFVTGWRVFGKVVKIIQPSHCVFIGVTAAKSFNHWIATQDIFTSNVSATQKLGGTWARMARLEGAGVNTELIFVKHLGLPFSWSKWNDYLLAQHPDFMKWLLAESYHTNATIS